MPLFRRLYRRLTDSHLPTRLISHVSVVGLVGAACIAGVTQGGGTTADAATNRVGLPTIVSSVRGAAEQTHPPIASAFDLDALPANHAAEIDRGAPAVVPDQPMPTPVPIDPNATPLAAPVAVGGTTTDGLSTRVSAPLPASGGLVWPVPGGSISQYFHAGHAALDIAAPYGSTIVAAQSGVVSSAGWRNNGGGYVITIDHGNGMHTSYNHLSGIWVGYGQIVGAGEAIGSVGCTGICTGPHVHFEIVVNGVIDNPQRYF